MYCAQYSTPHCSAQHGAVHCTTFQFSNRQYRTAQYKTVQCVALYSTAQHCTILFSTAEYCAVQSSAWQGAAHPRLHCSAVMLRTVLNCTVLRWAEQDSTVHHCTVHLCPAHCSALQWDVQYSVVPCTGAPCSVALHGTVQ